MPFCLAAAFGYQSVFTIFRNFFLQVASCLSIESIPIRFCDFSAFNSQQDKRFPACFFINWCCSIICSVLILACFSSAGIGCCRCSSCSRCSGFSRGVACCRVVSIVVVTAACEQSTKYESARQNYRSFFHFSVTSKEIV
ncbi:hypothetical protein D3C75_912080 [compost metagenome]